jgi:hypothetical protein
MSVTNEQIEAGQAVYTRRTLRAYDFVVLGVSNRLVWRCPTPRLLDHYNQHVTDNHLEVGVGSGYFLDHCGFASTSPRIALMDLNTDALEYASSRISRHKPETYRRDVLEPLSLECGEFDSVAVNYLLHCLPGTMISKSSIFDHLIACMSPGAVLFGSTLLQDGVHASWMARRLMNFYNAKGIFSNRSDNLADLESALRQRFRDVHVDIVGAAALFAGRRP